MVGGRNSRSAPLLVAAAASLLAAYLWTAWDRLGLGGAPIQATALLAAIGLLVARPLAASVVVFFAVPFFGNHPGGRYVELFNLPLAAAALGLALRGWRERRPVPRGPIALASLAVLASAALALALAVPAGAVRAAEVNDPALTLVQALVAAEGDPLYSLGATLQLALCVLWALGLRWAGVDLRFGRSALRGVLAGLSVVIVVGALRFFGLVDLRRWWFDRVDANLYFHDPLQSVFWNPGWLAGYLAVAIGLTLGLVWLEKPPWRWVVLTVLVASLAYVLLARQRSGVAAVLCALLLSVWLGSGGARRGRRRLAVAASGAVLALVASSALGTQNWQPGASRLLDGVHLDQNRSRLWRSALVMWRDAPLFGVGEGAFCWRYREFVPAGSSLDVPFSGDAHNTWLQVLATRGLVGVAALVALAFALGGATRRLLTAPAGDDRRGLGIAVACALSGALIYSLVQGLFYVQSLQGLFWGTVALASLGEADEPFERDLPPRWRGAVFTGLAVLVGARLFTAQPGWDGLGERLARQPRGFSPLRQTPNGPMRWSSRRGELCLYPEGPTTRVVLNAGRRPARLLPVVVGFRVGNRLVDRVVLARPGRVERVLGVPEGASPAPPSPPLPFGECESRARGVRLVVEVSSVWSRMVEQGFEDYKHRGVAIGPGTGEP